MIHEKIIVPRLEVHVSDYCNLRCDNCNHFSNYGIRGSITADEYEAWNRPWAKRIVPMNYQLLGGEPTVNPELVSICKLARQIWSNSQILLVSNGFFLDRHPELPAVLAESKIKLIISIHDDSERYTEKVNAIKKLIDAWSIKHKFDYHYRESFKNWVKTFKEVDGKIIPFGDDDPTTSWNNCLSKEAKQLYNGNLFKCPPLAYLSLLKKKIDLTEEWDFYLGYKPLTPDCSRSELEAFFSLKSESYCNMCAANPESYRKNDPLIQLSLKPKV